MDRKSLQNPEIERLTHLADLSRTVLTHHASVLREKLDVPTRVRASLKRSPLSWIGGSLASGFVASLLLGKKRHALASSSPVKSRSLPAAAFALALTAARPLAKLWLSKQTEKWLASTLAPTTRR